MKLFIISDCHGNIDGLNRALLRKGIIDKHGNRQLSRRHFVASIGDLANCVGDSIEGDKACLDLVGPVIDCLLIGNHEIPYFDPANKFWGFVWDNDINKKLTELIDNELVGMSILFDKTLITHAGLSKSMMSVDMDANEAHALIDAHFEGKNWNHGFFSSIGRARGGRNHVGGILWCDFEREMVPTKFPQIVGHTPKYVRQKANVLCIDVGAKDQETEPFILEVS